jgi:hypothetical protein
MTDAMRRLLHLIADRWDGALAIAATCVTFAFAAADRDVVHGAVPILLGLATAGLAVVGIVLTAIAILAAFFDPHYRRVLEAADGIRSALKPYLIVAAAGGASTVIGLVAAMAWPVSGPAIIGGAVLAACVGIATWAVFGVVSLVELTIFHAGERAALQRGVEDARAERAKRVTAGQ